MSNDFVPFANNPSNVIGLTTYDTLAPAGNITGIANSALVNRALRQGTTIAAVMAQLMANLTSTSIQDNQSSSDTAINQALLAQGIAAFGTFNHVSQSLSGSGTLGMVHLFFIATPTVTPGIGATYTNNGCTFTVLSTVGWPWLVMQATSGYAQPQFSGTLTKATGTGDATVTFYATRNPLYLDVYCKGGGGGGGGAIPQLGAPGGGEGGYVYARVGPLYTGYAFAVGAGGAGGPSGANAGSNGSSTTFGSSLITAGGGGQAGATASGTTPFCTGVGGVGGTATGGDINLPGIPGDPGFDFNGAWVGGKGGGNGGGHANYAIATTIAGVAGVNGGGGSGAAGFTAAGNAAGGAGATGLIFVRFGFQ